METDFSRREIDGINAKWRDIQRGSERKGEPLAIDCPLHIHPDLWLTIKDYLGKLSPIGRDPLPFSRA
jgi:hypothetical protein